MGKSYAANTQVSPERSIEEIKSTLRRFGAGSFSYYESDARGIAGLEFEMEDRRVRFVINLPRREEFLLTDTGRDRTSSAIQTEWEKAMRARWRSLALIVKAKLVAVDEDVVTFEQEFALHFVMQNGQTVYEQLVPHLSSICSASTLPALMPAG